jgi:biotin carboxyl carrier protein
MAARFEYDVFLSFASSDEELVKPVWQELCQSGLRVFWSDAALKRELGNSWFEIIESALDRSKHFVLFCSIASMNSVWVKREYRAFLDHCYLPGVRRLVPILAGGYDAKDLPLFLREIEAKQLEEPNSLRDIVSVLGGVNIEELKHQNELLKQSLGSLRRDKTLLEQEAKGLKAQLNKLRRIDDNSNNTQTVITEKGLSEIPDAFEFLGLSSTAASYQILQRYKSLKTEYESLLSNCPKRLREVCEQRLQSLESSFKSVFQKRKREEEEKIENAIELLQLPKGKIHSAIIRTQYEELKTACLRAMQSEDTFIKEAAANELEKLEDAYLTLTAKARTNANRGHALVDVRTPQLGESITSVTITQWLKKEGDYVERDEPLYEISTDKVDAEIPCPATGVLKTILFGKGVTVDSDTIVGEIEEIASVER